LASHEDLEHESRDLIGQGDGRLQHLVIEAGQAELAGDRRAFEGFG
jgi:hypothetical protein